MNKVADKGWKFLTDKIEEGSMPPRIPKIVCEDFSKDFAPAYLSNGLIGIRVGANPLAQAKTVVSGFVHANPYHLVEELCPAPYPLGTEIEVDCGSHKASLLKQPELLTIKRQTLDMATGELLTEMTFKPCKNSQLNIEVLQFASRSVPCLLCQEIKIVPSADLSIKVSARIDMEGVPATVYFQTTRNVDMAVGLRSDLDSKLGVSVIIDADKSFERMRDLIKIGSAFTKDYKLRAKHENTYTVRTIAAMVSSVYHPAPELQAIRMVNWGKMLGFKVLREQNRKKWEELWKSRIKVYGDERAREAQIALDVAFFYLHSSIHPSCRTGLPPFGLSSHDAYFGHVFWDSDVWCFIPILLTTPHTARALVEYRFRGLENAKKTAALYGYRGAQYPWESAIDGSEATPTDAATGWAEQHITPDVGLLFWEYYLATNDSLCLQEMVWPALKLIAEWIESRGVFTERGFEIHNVMGPDESVLQVNNSLYMNLVCKMVMDAAIKCAKKIGVTPPSSWKKISKSIVIPVDQKLNVALPCDNPPKPESPAYSLGSLQYLFLHEPPLDRELIKNTYQYEEKIRASRPPAPSNPCSKAAPGFTCPPFAVMAAFYGDKKKALKLFENSWKPYWVKPYGITKEYQQYKDGCYVTNFGSLLQAVMLGFTGLRISEGDWCKYPATLPEGWTKIEIDRIWVKGKAKKLVAEDGKIPKLIDIDYDDTSIV